MTFHYQLLTALEMADLFVHLAHSLVGCCNVIVRHRVIRTILECLLVKGYRNLRLILGEVYIS